MPASPGIIPDMRYLSPAYLPLLVIGVYALKHAGMDADGVRKSLKTLFWLAVIDLPLIFAIAGYVLKAEDAEDEYSDYEGETGGEE